MATFISKKKMIFTDIHEYVEDQLNVAVKNFAKYLFDDIDGLIYLLHEGLV